MMQHRETGETKGNDYPLLKIGEARNKASIPKIEIM
jgi:hypothetical protein